MTKTAKSANASATVEAPRAHPMRDKKYEHYVGTAQNYIQAGVEINGLPVDSVALSILSRFGVVKVVGKTERKPDQRGKASTIYSIQGRPGLSVSIPETAPVLQEKVTHLKATKPEKGSNLQAMAMELKNLAEKFLQNSNSAAA